MYQQLRYFDFRPLKFRTFQAVNKTRNDALLAAIKGY